MTMKKRILSLLLALIMVISLLPSAVFAAEEAAVVHDDLAQSNEVYQIGTAAELFAFAATVNGGTNTVDAVLTADIDLGGEAWTPIGTAAYPYIGYFNGQGHTVSGIAISGNYGPDQEKGKSNIGLFGNIQNAGIRNLTVNGSVTASAKNAANAGYAFGSGLLVGVMQDSILENCYAQVNIQDSGISTGALAGTAMHSIIINCGATGTMKSSSAQDVGGLVGYMTAGYDYPLCLLNSYSMVDIVSEDNNASVGGLAGYLADDAVNNYFGGTLTGGGTNNTMGLLFGYVSNQILETPGSTERPSVELLIEKNYYSAASTGKPIGGALEGLDTTGYTAAYSSHADLQTTLNGNLGRVDEIIAGHRGYLSTTQWADLIAPLDGANVRAFHWGLDETPFLCESDDYTDGFCTVCGMEQPIEFFEISNADELYAFAEQVNAGNTTLNGKLTADIVINKNVLTDSGALNGSGSGLREWKAIRNYAGIFDGGGHTISGLYYKSGLFNNVEAAGKVQNVRIVDAFLISSNNFGGVVGRNYGSVTNCEFTGTITGDYWRVGGVVGSNYAGGTVTDCVYAGTVTGDVHVGGLVGYNDGGTVTGCRNSGAVTGSQYVGGVVGNNDGGTVTGCGNSGAVTGLHSVGGVAGRNGSVGTVTNCSNTGAVHSNNEAGGVVSRNGEGCTVTNCCNTGAVTSEKTSQSYVGGVVTKNSGSVGNCYYDSTVFSGSAIGSDESDGGVSADVLGKTTEQFKTGEVAYLLQGEQTEQIWGQTIGEEDYPVLGGAKVYGGYINCTERYYSNDPNTSQEQPEHDYDPDTGVCIYCGDVKSIDYDLWIGRKRVTSANAADVFGDGKVSYDAKNNILTLNNYTYSGAAYLDGTEGIQGAIHYSGLETLELVLVGESSVASGEDTGESTCGLYAAGDIIVSGTGSLTAIGGDVKSARSYGVYMGSIRFDGDITVNSGSLIAVGGTAVDGNSKAVLAGNITVNGGSLIAIGGTADDESQGVKANNITVNGGSLTAKGGDAPGDSRGVYLSTALNLGEGIIFLTPANGKFDAKQYAIVDAEGNIAKEVEIGEIPPTPYDLWVGGTQVNSANAANVFGDGTVSYDAEQKILTLNNYTYSGGPEVGAAVYAAIYYEGADTLELALVGENSVTHTGTGSDLGDSYGVRANGSITVSGTGSLTAAGGDITDTAHWYHSYGVYTSSITVTGGSLFAVGGEGYDTYGVYAGYVTVNSGSLTATSGAAENKSIGLQANGVTVNGGALTATGGTAVNSEGLSADSIEVTGGSLTATGGEGGISTGASVAGKVTVSGGSLTAIGGTATSEDSLGMYAVSSVTVTGGSLKVKAGDALNGSSTGAKWYYALNLGEGIAILNPVGGKLDTARSAIVDAEGNIAKEVEIGEIPATAYDLWIGGEQFTSEKLTVNGGTGTATFDPEQGILTLNNYTYSGVGTTFYDTNWEKNNHALLYAEIPLTVVLTGSSSLTCTDDNGCGIATIKDLTFDGDGELAISRTDYGIYAVYTEDAPGAVTINNVTLGIDADVDGIYTFFGSVTMDGCDVRIHSDFVGIFTEQKDVTIRNAAVNITTVDYDEYGIWTIKGGNISIESGDVTVQTGGSSVLLAEGGTVTVADGMRVYDKEGKVIEEPYFAALSYVHIKTIQAYDVWVAGEQLTEEKLTVNGTTGTATYDPETDTLTLNGFDNGGKAHFFTSTNDFPTYAAIYTQSDLNIVLEGETTLSVARVAGAYGALLHSDAGLTISGTGLLANGACNWTFGTVTGLVINGGTVEVDSDTGFCGPVTLNGGHVVSYAYNPFDSVFTVNGGVAEFSTRDAGITYNFGKLILGAGMAAYDEEGNVIANPDFKNLKYALIKAAPCDHSGNENQDDGDCTTELLCSVCGEVVVAAKEHHTFDYANADAYTNKGRYHTVSCLNCQFELAQTHGYENGVCICGAQEPTNAVYSLPGTFNGWDFEDTTYELTMQADGTYMLTTTIPAGDQEFKVFEDAFPGRWYGLPEGVSIVNGEPMTLYATDSEPNMKLSFAVPTEVTFVLDPNTMTLTVSWEEGSAAEVYRLVGTFNDWMTGNTTHVLTKLADGTYSLIATIPAGEQEFKVVKTDVAWYGLPKGVSIVNGEPVTLIDDESLNLKLSFTAPTEVIFVLDLDNLTFLAVWDASAAEVTLAAATDLIARGGESIAPLYNGTELRWTDNADNETGYRILRTWNGETKTVAELAADSTSWTDSDMTGAGTYTYTVQAYNDHGTADSAPVSVTFYTIRVYNGEASPIYAAAGTEVEVTADIRPGWAFQNWQSVDVEFLLDGSQRWNRFIMPASNVDVTAVFEECYHSYERENHFDIEDGIHHNAVCSGCLQTLIEEHTYVNGVCPCGAKETNAVYSLVGDFSGWEIESKAYDLTKRDDGTYTLETALAGGNYEFAVYKNHSWVPCYGLPYGTTDAVLANGTTTVLEEGGMNMKLALAAPTEVTFVFDPNNLTLTASWEASAEAVAPAAPTDLTVSCVYKGVKLSWTDNADNETGYRIFCTWNGEEIAGAELAADTTSWTDEDLRGAGTYTYIVQAYNDYSAADTEPASITLYTIEVIGGEADMAYAAAGTTVKIDAAIPVGMKFTGWVSAQVEFDVASTERWNRFTMPAANVTVTAEYVQCDHSGEKFGHTPTEDGARHTVYCADCSDILTEDHTYVNGVCRCGVQEPVSAYTFQTSTQLYLKEPWAFRANVYVKQGETYLTEAELGQLESGFWFIPAAALGDTVPTAEEIANHEKAVHMDATVAMGSNGQYKLSADYTEGIYTYQLDEVVYVVAYVDDGNGVQYTAVKSRNLLELAKNAAADEAFDETERAVYTRMVEMHTAITAHRDTFSSIPELQRVTAPYVTAGMFGEYKADLTVKHSTQIVLIEPWGIKLNGYIDGDYTDYGLVISTKAGTLDELVQDTTARVYSVSGGTAEKSGTKISGLYTEEIYTYLLDQDLYVAFYAVDESGYHFGEVKCRNILDLVKNMAKDTAFSATERAVYEAMINMHTDVTTHRAKFGR